jgi:hypothetical protein
VRAGEEGDGEEQGGDGAEDERVGGLHGEEQGGDEARGPEPFDDVQGTPFAGPKLEAKR